MKQLKITPLILLLAGIFVLQSCESGKNNWVLKGTTELQGDKVYLYHVEKDFRHNLVDSAAIDNKRFMFTGTNADDNYEPYFICTNKPEAEGLDLLLMNGDKLRVDLKERFGSEFSGTKIAEDLNHYMLIKQTELAQNLSFPDEMADLGMDDESRNRKMIAYREKVQELENEKIDFLRSLMQPDLNGYLVCKELENSGVIEREVVKKYMDALTAEGALTNSGIKVHRIFDVFDAYALSLEMEFLDTATIKARYNNLDEENKNSVYAREVLEHLETVR